MTNKQAMIEHIATEVMGWRIEETLVYGGGIIKWWYDDKNPDPWVCHYDRFNPFENHQQAFDALHAWLAVDDNRKYQLQYSFPSKKTRAHLWGHLPQGVTEAYGDNELTAICTAICRATGYQSENEQ